MLQANILWVDDEIEFLRPHVLFLQEKGFHITTANNGNTAVDLVRDKNFDLIFLDEQMPGLSGIETLPRIRNVNPHVPVIMVTKSEEENIMEEAIGSHISDYLIKPVKPTQLLLTIKKFLDDKRIISEKSIAGYQKEFREISHQLDGKLDHHGWVELYRKLVHWDLMLEESSDRSMADILNDQKEEANRLFGRFVENNYLSWLQARHGDQAPVQSHRLLKEKLFPLLSRELPVFLILIDNLRYDQWKIIEPVIARKFHIESDELYYSILPTTTQYARNAIFSGLLPSELERRYPDLWMEEDEEGSKNRYEEQLITELVNRNNIRIKVAYHKVISHQDGKKLSDSFSNLMQNDVIVIVYNFVDALSHARTDVAVIRDLAENESAYRAVTLSWFQHSPLLEVLNQAAEKKCRVIITTDHGSVRVTRPAKVIGTRELNTNLRYKKGQGMQYDRSDVFEVKEPARAFLPKPGMNTVYLFAKHRFFFAYPNNFNHYVKHYQNTFQHGGISMEEMLVPAVVLRGK